MFTTLKYRRHIAVLATLAMVASVMVAAPAVAADPEPNFKATFDACSGVESAGFEDVSANHANAGDIDCIAYYGITKGTSPTTYSPSMSVTREHMALFLTRLAALVGIEATSTPADAGFTDIGDLSAESQTAINQLADLGITKGTSTSTYSPADSVTRGQMALFIARLMNQMDPLADGSMKYGNLPSVVAKNADDHPIGSPYTDLGTATKDAYDAITQLYELGVVSGISDTSYGPSALITRAAMAEFMAGVLDHSNARPAGLSIQVQGGKTMGFGAIAEAVVLVSYRTDSFAPMEGMLVDVFSSEEDNKGLNKDGTCAASVTDADSTACEQDANDPATDERGNHFITDGGATAGNTNTYYAWTGESGDKFDADEVNFVTATISSSPAFDSLKVTSSAGMNSASTDSTETTVTHVLDLDVTTSVTLTVQLRAGDKDSPEADEEVKIRVQQDSDNDLTNGLSSDNTYTMKTDAEGTVTFTVNAPANATAGAGNDVRYDTITISSGTIEADSNPSTADTADPLVIKWSDGDAQLTSATGSTSLPYAVISGTGANARARIPVSVTLYDQYGNIHRASGQTVTFDSTASGITFPGTATDSGERNAVGGRASYTLTVAGTGIAGAVSWSATVSDGDADTTEPTVTTTELSVQAVTLAPDDTPVTTGTAVVLHEKQNKFHNGTTNVLYSYDSDDQFVRGGKVISLDEFESALKADNTLTVAIPVYDEDGSSIFVIG